MHKESWQTALSESVTDPIELFNLLELDHSLLKSIYLSEHFPLRVPRSFIAKMQKNNINDPLLKQVLPLSLELNSSSGYLKDPLDEQNKNPIPGLLHKFKGRVLLVVTGACGIHCRYCFRQNFTYSNNLSNGSHLEKILNYLANDHSITEVILSGGDPLVTNDIVLNRLISSLEKIPHLKRLRLHSRMPIVIPERITDNFISLLANSRLKNSLVVHCNHPNELDLEIKHIFEKLIKAGIMLLNQSVLLKDVNDKAEILIELSEKLFEYHVLPYYLHILDKVQGAAHFDLAIKKAITLHQEISSHLPGYLVPKLVKEEPGAPAKVLVD